MILLELPRWLNDKKSIFQCGRSLGRKDPLEKEMAIHSSTLSWKTPWTEKPGRLQSMRSQRVGHKESGYTTVCLSFKDILVASKFWQL